MSAISQKSITGITSITTPTGVDNQLTLHTNNTTERVKIDVAGNVHINNQLAVAGVSTFSSNVTISKQNAVLELSDPDTSDANYQIRNDNGTFDIKDSTNSTVKIRATGSYVTVYPNLNANNGLDVMGTINGEDLIITGTSVVADLKSTNNNYVLGLAGNNSSVKSYFGTDSSGNFLLATGSGVDERLRITSDGKVGINCGPTALPLEVKQQSADGGALRLRDSSAQYRYLEFDVTGALTQITARSNNSHGKIDIGTLSQFGRRTCLFIENNGEIGIGTDSVEGNLHVFNSSAGSVTAATDANELVLESAANVGMSFLTANDALSRIKFGDPDATNAGIIIYSHADDSLRFQHTSNERLRISANGNVGIGSDNPHRKLVVGNNAGMAVIGSNAGIYLGTHPTGGFQNNAAIARAAANNYHISGSVVGDLCIAGESTADILIGTSAHAGAMAERIRITSNGNVRVGGGDPATFGSGTTVHETYNASTYVANLVTSGARQLQMIASATHGASSIGTRSNHNLYLTTNDTNRVTITTSGNVGINDIAPASNSLLSVKTDGLDDNTYGFSTEYRSGNNASGYTASGIVITSQADNSNGEDHTAFIRFSNRTASQNGAHGVASFITLSTPDAQGTYGTGEYNFYIRNGAPYSFPNDPAVSSNFWMSSLFKIKSSGELFGYNNLRIDTGTAADGVVGRAYGTAYFGLKQADQSSSEYMMISNNSHTYISCTSGSSIYLRPSANSSAHETVFSHDNTTFKTNVVLDNHALRRNQHQWGHMEGGYNNIGASTLKSSPIYTIGSAYNPNEETLGNMYGVGYTHKNASFINSNVAGSWGLYLASDGDARIFLGASDGRIFADQAYGRTSWHKGHLEGGHTNIGASQSKTNPIFTIGSSYNPNESDLSNMYGVGYANGDNASYLPAGGWGLYVASDGDARLFLDAQTGIFKFNGGHGAVHFTNGTWSGEHSTGKIQTHGNNMYFQNAGGSWQFRKTNGTAASNIASNGTYSASDLTFKKDVATISNSVDTIKKLTGRSFTWKEDNKKSFGVIAQEVETVLPELVILTEEPEGSEVEPSKMVNYPALTGHFIEAIKELSAKIETLESKVAALEG